MTIPTFTAGTLARAADLQALADAVASASTQGMGLNVKAYGAVGDGTTNDTAAFAAAMAAAALMVGTEYYGDKFAPVYVPPGNYIATVDVPYGVGLIGAGQGAVTIAPPASANRSVIRLLAPTSAPGFAKSNYTRQVVTGLSVNGYAGAQTAGSGIEVQATPYAFSNPTYTAGATITDCKIISPKDDGLLIGSNRNWCLVSRVICNSPGLTPLRISSFDNRFTDCDFGGGQWGIRIDSGGSNSFEGCNIYGNTKTNLVKSPYATSYNFFTNCTFDQAEQQGLYIQGSGSDSEIAGFVNCNFTNASHGATGANPFFELVDAPTVHVIGGKVRRDSGNPQANYIVRASGTGTPRLVWIGVDYTTGSLVPYSVAAFSTADMLQPTAPYSPAMLVRSGTQYTGVIVQAADGTSVAGLQGTGTTNKGGYLALYNTDGSQGQVLAAPNSGALTRLAFAPYTLSTLPAASAHTGYTFRVSDRNQKFATSDGTNWRFQDGTIAS